VGAAAGPGALGMGPGGWERSEGKACETSRASTPDCKELTEASVPEAADSEAEPAQTDSKEGKALRKKK